MFEHGAQHRRHLGLQLTARRGLGGQQQQGTGIHEGGGLITAEADQVLIPAVCDVQAIPTDL